jgi:hypothetical protein
MKLLHRIEDISVRVMYFFNVTDSFLPFSVLFLFVILQTGFLPINATLFPPLSPSLAFFFAFLYVCCRLADFHVFFLLLLAPAIGCLFAFCPHPGAILGGSLACFFLLTTMVQIIFMGLPMGMASRSADVPLRMYLHSFVILAPTTISLPVTLGYQLLFTASLNVLSDAPFPGIGIYALVLLTSALCIRVIVRRIPEREKRHPTSAKPLYKRVVLLNIDGLSFHAFTKANAPFLHHLRDTFSSADRGADTIYKAFTNPAFASILSGTHPIQHGVINNNFGQKIKTQALPDFIDTRLYGSMHVKHFSRPSWNVSLVSLVELGYDKADDSLMETFKNDLLEQSNTKLWLVDLSRADYCGHAWGSYSKKYYEAIEATDHLMRDFFSWCVEKSLVNDTLFIISSDHGLFIGEHAYGLVDQEKKVPLMFVGKTIGKRKLMDVSITDIAANISYFLGVPYCKESGGQVFEEMIVSGEESMKGRISTGS